MEVKQLEAGRYRFSLISDYHRKVFHLSPNLQTLTLHAIAHLGVSDAACLATSILSLTQLVQLEMQITQGHAEVIRNLSSHPNLRKLVFSSPSANRAPRDVPDFPWTTVGEPILPGLEMFSSILPTTQATAILLMDLRRSHSLKQLMLSDALDSDVEREEEETSRDASAVCREIGRHTDLQTLELRFLPTVLSMALIGPIMRCQLLETLAIDVNTMIDLQDDDVHALATSLPRLRKLKLNVSAPYEYGEEDTSLSLMSIVHLVAACRNLSSIEMLLDARLPIPQPDTVEAARIPARESLKLIVAFSPIGDDRYEGIALFLQSLGVQRTITMEAWSEDLPPPPRKMKVDYLSMWAEVKQMMGGVAE